MKRLMIMLLLVLTNISYAGMLLNKAVIHHTASHDVSAKEIDRWHKERGWTEIGYHFVIRKDGSIEKGRDINKIGAHAKNPSPSRNNRVGIALTGYDEFTEEQYKALGKLLKQLEIQYAEGHHQDCPGEGFDWNKVVSYMAM